MSSQQTPMTAALETSHRAQCASNADAVRFENYADQTALQQLLQLPHHERRWIIEQDPSIDIYLGKTRVYKRTSRELLFASCPDIGRFLTPVQGSFAVCLPEGITTTLSVKLVVLYTEQYLLNAEVRAAPWKVNQDFVLYISLAELFDHIGMSQVALELKAAIFQGMQQRRLDAKHIYGIWARERTQHSSRYAEALADNILTFTDVAEIELFLLEYDTEPSEGRRREIMQRRATTSLGPAGKAQIRARWETRRIEDMLAHPANLALKQLVWTANILPSTWPSQPAVWLEIGLVDTRGAGHRHTAMRKIVLKRANDLGL